MKKILFYISVLLAVFYFAAIIKNLLFEVHQQTNYFYGMLTGKILLFIVFCTISFYSNRPFWTKIFAKK